MTTPRSTAHGSTPTQSRPEGVVLACAWQSANYGEIRQDLAAPSFGKTVAKPEEGP